MKKKRKLVLHFDLRNTVLVADTVTKIKVEQALNTYLTGVTWGRETPGGEWEWLSDVPSLTAPHPKAITYYKHLEKQFVRIPSDRGLLRQVTGDFTQVRLGERFLPYFENHLKLLEWEHGMGHDPLFTMMGANQRYYHYILPSFFNLINHLNKFNRDFTVIFRTYGMDAPSVLACTELFTQGLHPAFPEIIKLSVESNPGKILRRKSAIELFDSHGTMGLTSESAIYKHIGNRTGICAYVDDFHYWQDHNYHFSAGKPLWINLDDDSVHHIMFDDNIRAYDDDNIVNVRLCRTENSHGNFFSTLPLSHENKFEDIFLVQADLLESIANENYFIEKIAKCENNLDELLQHRGNIDLPVG